LYKTPRPAELTLINGDDSVCIRPAYGPPGGTLAGNNPVACRTWDLGSPDMRYTSVPNPGTDGVTESIGFLGSRQVTFDLQVLGGPDPQTGQVHDAYYYVGKLVRMTHPSAKPVLMVRRHDELSARRPWWRMDLRGSPFTLTFGRTSAAMVELQLVFTCPLGLLECDPPLTFRTPTPNPAARTDWVFPATFKKGFGVTGGNANPTVYFPVGGDAAIQPTIWLYGPMTNPEMRSGNDTFRFVGLTLDPGQSAKIDMESGDIIVNTGTSPIPDDLSAYAYVDWTVSTYWTWAPGNHQFILYSPTGYAVIEFAERRLTI
jgi:hypothetical protein